MNDQELELLYTRQLNEELLLQTRTKINKLVENYPHEFGLDSLFPNNMNSPAEMPEKLAQLYQEICEYYNDNVIEFDHVWSWSFIWRQQLAYKNLAETYGGVDQIVNASNPRARKAVKQIYLEGLDQYMQWFPWSWISNMQFIGAGGFSAVYGAHMSPPYDIEPVKVALKVVDDKLLNEISVQSKAFLPLLFQGLTVCESTGDLMMVMKMSNDGNLEDHMQQLPLGDLDLKTITGTILRLAVNLADLHKAELCHRNVHPRNIMCTDSDYFLVDYRFSTPSKESSSVTALTKAVYGRLPYIAPEVRRGVYTEKSDIYSLGIIIWQLVSKVIFPSPDVLLDGSQNCNFMDNAYRIEPVPGIPDWYHKLYISCLEPRPDNRPTANDLCQVLHMIHNSLEYTVPLNRDVTEYIVARRAEVADHLRTYSKIKGIVSASTTRLFTLSNLPSTEHFVELPFTNEPFDTSSWHQFLSIQQLLLLNSLNPTNTIPTTITTPPTVTTSTTMNDQQQQQQLVTPSDIFASLESAHLLV